MKLPKSILNQIDLHVVDLYSDKASEFNGNILYVKIMDNLYTIELTNNRKIIIEKTINYIKDRYYENDIEQIITDKFYVYIR